MSGAHDRPQNPLHERYATAEMARTWSTAHRYGTWRTMWLTLAECQKELGLDISESQLEALREAAPRIDFARVAEIERETRHDVVAHLRHFAEEAGEAGGILHLGATSAFITDNTDVLILRDALGVLRKRLATVIGNLAEFARSAKDIPALAYTHFQPAQLTTIGKRACLWLQDFLIDLDELDARLERLRCRGAKGTTGTQASFLVVFDGDHEKVRELDRRVAERLGFDASWPVTGQTYPRKQDSQILQTLSGIGESCHKFGTDLRLLQGVGELGEPFDANQVGSSAMPYKRNPVRAERMCGLARRLITDALNGPMNASTQWLERSLDDSANRRLVLGDAFLGADAILTLAGGISGGIRIIDTAVAARVAREIPFMATETMLMKATVGGGDRQDLHERIRQHSLEAHAEVARGGENPLLHKLAADDAIGVDADNLDELERPELYIGRSAEQVEEYLSEVVEPRLEGVEAAPVEQPRI